MVRYVLVGVAVAFASLLHAPAAGANPICQTVDINRPVDQLPVSLCLPYQNGTTCDNTSTTNNVWDVSVTICVPSVVQP